VLTKRKKRLPQKRILNLEEIYNLYLTEINDRKVEARYKDKSWFHSSSAGLCTRKHFFSSVSQDEGTPIDTNTRRLFRLGDLVHEDIQNAVSEYANRHGLSILIEKEIYIDDLNVRGFIDLALLDNNILYDIKTCNSWKWTKMFGAKGQGPDLHQQMQLATYGMWAANFYDIDDIRLVLLYYNKNTSEIREFELLSSGVMAEAEAYWFNVMEMCEPVDDGTEGIDFISGDINFIVPPVELGVSPVYKWECSEKYCRFYEVCGGGLNAGKS
jgi:hypothetical protein